MKKWLTAHPVQPATLDQLQALLEDFVEIYNQHRPHRSLAHRATPATVYTARPKAAPSTDRATDTHDRVRTDKIDKSGTVTLRVAGKLRHIGIGRPHAGTHVLLLAHDLHVRVIDAATGELLRDLDIDPTRDYQPRGHGTPQQRMPWFNTSRTGVSRHAGRMSQVMPDVASMLSHVVQGTSGDYRCRPGEPSGRRCRARLRGLPVLGL